MAIDHRVDPAQKREPGSVRSPEIPVNAYRLDLIAEVSRYTNDGLINVLHDMIIIREFESMLQSITTTGAWQGITAKSPGLVHLSMGQEAVSVGQALELKPEDLIFGTHRCHGDLLAKAFSAVRKISEAEVRKVMESFLDGETLKYAEHLPHATEAEVQANFILFGALGEVFSRRSGFNRGMAGATHVFFPPFGSMPNNGIVGGSAPLATGAALYKRINSSPGIVVASLGDGALGTGAVWESMIFSAMSQYRELWGGEPGGNPPLLFHVVNNFYARAGRTASETMAFDVLARAGAGINPQAMHSERVDGFNPLAVANAVRRKKDILLAGHGPALLDTITYRYAPHNSSDTSTYRSPEEVEAWEQLDPIASFAATLINGGLITSGQVEEIYTRIVDKLTQVLRMVADEKMCPQVDAHFVESVTFSQSRGDALGSTPPELLIPAQTHPRIQGLAHKARMGTDQAATNTTPTYRISDGIFEAMAHRFVYDPSMVAWGQDIRETGGQHQVCDGLGELLPPNRLFNTPVSSAAMVGAGAGYAMCGGRAVVEVMASDFLGQAGDEIINQVAKWQAISAGLLRMPLVIRVCVADQGGPQFAQDFSSLISHIPGLKVYYPATPTDAKGMLNRALVGTDPVIFFESQKLYDMAEYFAPGGVPQGYYEVDEGDPALRCAGDDVTIATLGPSLYTAMGAAETLRTTYQMTAEVIDLRFAVPLNYEKILASVKKTGRLVLVSDAPERGSFLHSIATHITTLAFDDLDAPVVVLGARNHVHGSPIAGESFTPQASTILDAIHSTIVPLKGHVLSTEQGSWEVMRRSALGV
ncbi:MAG: thiamine pyrophosphate-dependent enzyme [Propionibacteriaceae bacterium]|nr:thiamine pyrophosphate-dependent enzyme [Propionibacteriaceae bacterium]